MLPLLFLFLLLLLPLRLLLSSFFFLCDVLLLFQLRSNFRFAINPTLLCTFPLRGSSLNVVLQRRLYVTPKRISYSNENFWFFLFSFPSQNHPPLIQCMYLKQKCIPKHPKPKPTRKDLWCLSLFGFFAKHGKNVACLLPLMMMKMMPLMVSFYICCSQHFQLSLLRQKRISN